MLPRVPNVIWALVLTLVAILIQTYFSDQPLALLALPAITAIIKSLGYVVSVKEEEPPAGTMSSPNNYGGRKRPGFIKHLLLD